VSFLYPFLTFLQPGILWPEIAEFRPLIVAGALGLLAGLARTPAYPRRVAFTHPIFVWLLVYTLVQMISVYRSGGQIMLAEFTFWIVYVVFMVVSVLLISDAVALKRYVWGMIAGVMFLVVYGIYAAVETIGLGPLGGRASAYGMYGNPNDYTFIILLIVPFIYMYWRHEAGFVRRSILGLSMIGCIAGVFLSYSRGGILALVLEFALIALLGMQGKRRLLVLPVVAMLGAAAIVYQFSARMDSDALQSGYSTEDSATSRFELWRAGLLMLRANPLLGVGSRRFGANNKEYGDVKSSHWGYPAHNTYIEILSGSGLIGFMAFALMTYHLLRELWRRPRTAGPPWLEATRGATLISFLTLLFRAYFSSRQYDWCFFVLCVIGLACCVLQRQLDSAPAVATRGSA
jgi:O-antigen ligase